MEEEAALFLFSAVAAGTWHRYRVDPPSCAGLALPSPGLGVPVSCMADHQNQFLADVCDSQVGQLVNDRHHSQQGGCYVTCTIL